MEPIQSCPKVLGRRYLLYPLGINRIDEDARFIGYWWPLDGGYWVMEHVGHLNGHLKPTHWSELAEIPKQ